MLRLHTHRRVPSVSQREAGAGWGKHPSLSYLSPFPADASPSNSYTHLRGFSFRAGPLESLDELEHVLNARDFRAVVPRGVVSRFSDLHHLDDAVDNVHGGALAALRVEAKRLVGAVVNGRGRLGEGERVGAAGHLDPERIGHRRLRVRDEVDHLRPSESLSARWTCVEKTYGNRQSEKKMRR